MGGIAVYMVWDACYPLAITRIHPYKGIMTINMALV